MDGITDKFKTKWPSMKAVLENDLTLLVEQIDNQNWLGAGYVIEAHGFLTSVLAKALAQVIEENHGLGAKEKNDEEKPLGQYL